MLLQLHGCFACRLSCSIGTLHGQLCRLGVRAQVRGVCGGKIHTREHRILTTATSRQGLLLETRCELTPANSSTPIRACILTMLCCSCSSWSASCLLAEDLDRDVAGDSCLGMGGLRLPRGELSEELRLTLRTVAQPDPMQTGLKSGGLAVKTKAVLAGCEEIPQSSATALRVPQRTVLAPGRSSLGTSAPPRHRLSPVREAALRSARLCM